MLFLDINDPTINQLAKNCSTKEFHRLTNPINTGRLIHYPNGLPQPTKQFNVKHFLIQLLRQLNIIYRIDWQSFLLTNVQFFFTFYFGTTFYRPTISLPSGCIPLMAPIIMNDSNSIVTEIGDDELDDRLNLQLTNSTNHNCLTTIMDDDIELRENGTFLAYTFMFTGFFTMCLGAIFISPFVKIFRSEHRNRKLNCLFLFELLYN